MLNLQRTASLLKLYNDLQSEVDSLASRLSSIEQEITSATQQMGQVATNTPAPIPGEILSNKVFKLLWQLNAPQAIAVIAVPDAEINDSAVDGVYLEPVPTEATKTKGLFNFFKRNKGVQE